MTAFGETWPADWTIAAPLGWQGPATVTTPSGILEFETLAQAVVYRDLIVTRSRSVDRDKARAAL